MNQKETSKFLSLILRHQPELIGLKLDTNGWADVDTLLALAARRKRITKAELETIVAESDKQRFAFNEDRTKIRANQGHSIHVDLELPVTTPPEFLFHGTTGAFVSDILKTGIQKMSRQYVHLSVDKSTATKVGSRRGVPVILTIRSGDMYRDGIPFFVSANGVWLTDHVPAKYISQ
ncbi:RNA 2'-phosphotransferase [Chitinophaga sancti]|uniref:Probable RNA 2'-phosphotransferase n=1 Tax=Chitinophaga sancti TaxID=1004 RepID=A0A1K1S2F2_9BACT|nr:RNA 2'-phosphotransferase [Chitinophaga sancti]WQD59686.1 RNA 2'-phosphotransferase [Chitinophaga sancti]WQG88183.1 RNA 2'-phosphotransferase [Chitinophaga sancti]SFW78255.1 putative RNA 2'-phosphotransferase [Chitinophaga sancti]